MKEEQVISRLAIYTIKKNKVKYVSDATREFLGQVHDKEHGIVTYRVFQNKKKPHEFIHFMVFKNRRAEKLHKSAKHMKRLVDIIYPNSSKEPVFIDLNKVH